MEDRELVRSLGRLEGKLDALITTVGAIKEDQKVHDNRISSLEGDRKWILGGAAVLGALLAFVGFTATSLLEALP